MWSVPRRRRQPKTSALSLTRFPLPSLSADFTLAVVGRKIGIAHPPAGLNLPLLNLERVSVGLPLEKLLEERWRTSERRGYCSAPKLTLHSSSSLVQVSSRGSLQEGAF